VDQRRGHVPGHTGLICWRFVGRVAWILADRPVKGPGHAGQIGPTWIWTLSELEPDGGSGKKRRWTVVVLSAVTVGAAAIAARDVAHQEFRTRACSPDAKSALCVIGASPPGGGWPAGMSPTLS